MYRRSRGGEEALHGKLRGKLRAVLEEKCMLLDEDDPTGLTDESR